MSSWSAAESAQAHPPGPACVHSLTLLSGDTAGRSTCRNLADKTQHREYDKEPPWREVTCECKYLCAGTFQHESF
eukprot:5102549-Amphidinium_carterae.1